MSRWDSMKWYTLDGHKVVPFEGDTPPFPPGDDKWRVALDRVVLAGGGGVTVSTVFLCLDHGTPITGPLFFETLVFGGDMDGEMVRYETWEQAEKGHTDMLARVTGHLEKVKVVEVLEDAE